VVKSTIVADFFLNEKAATMYSMKVGVTLTDSSTSFGAAAHQDISEQPRSRAIILPAQAGAVRRILWSYTPKSFFAIKDAQDEEDLYFTSSASPTEQAAFHVWGYAMDSQTQEGFVSGYIDYTVLMLHPILPASSQRNGSP